MHLYPTGCDAATPALTALLHEEIATKGPLPFPRFMELALYHPEHGYYARETSQVGRDGDFFTSVSVGPLFGSLLARRFLRWWRAAGHPITWRVIECGAHDGKLARDILETIRTLEPSALTGLEYVIPEPLPRLRAAQRETLSAFLPQLAQIPHPDELSHALPGIAFGNEVLDALPFRLIEWRDGSWHEIRVTADPTGAFAWDTGPDFPSGKLPAELRHPISPMPEGYRTELRDNLASFLAPLTRALTQGLLLWPDYGYARPDYYHPARSEGTLRTFSRHRAGDDPLDAPGTRDITAHVDFTAVAEAAITLGARPAAFRSQGSWLTHEAREWLASLEGRPDPSALRQFQTLTHPAHLGGRFHMLELAWNDPAMPDIPAADLRRLAFQGQK